MLLRDKRRVGFRSSRDARLHPEKRRERAMGSKRQSQPRCGCAGSYSVHAAYGAT